MAKEKSQKQKKLHLDALVVGLVCIVLGILFLVFPKNSLNIITYASGIVLLIVGVIEIFLFFYNGMKESSGELVLGAVAICLGIILLVKSDLIQTIITIIFGIVLVAEGVQKVQKAIALYRIKKTAHGIIYTILAAVLIALGVVIIVNPFSETALAYFIGGCLLGDGICEIALVAFENTKPKDEVVLKEEVQEANAEEKKGK